MIEPKPGPNSLWRRLSVVLLTLALLSSHAFGQATGVAPKPASTLTPAEREASARVSAETIREVTTALSSKEMEGRGTAQPGGDRAAKYIADRFAKLGLKPLGDAGTYLQAIKFKTTMVTPDSMLKAGDVEFKLGSDFVPAPPFTAEQTDASGPLVFVGYGVTAADLKHDDLAGIDVKGKVAVMLSGRPKGVDEAAWAKVSGPQAVAMNLIGRGAVGLIILNIGTERQPFSLIADYLTRRQAQLADAPEIPFKIPPIILASDAGAEKLFAGSGATYAQTLAKAANNEMVSRDLDKQVSISVRIRKETATGSNVVGLLEGSDPKLKDQAVIYTAHYDAFGITADGRIYPGAADNALGVSELMAIAE
ncbi:MAG TPA: M28 family peptidase, partial [Pyrinomonadaceae bacterium]|nr:M28 family peptidase [Pyrinomonadaceae bacterium]